MKYEAFVICAILCFATGEIVAQEPVANQNAASEAKEQKDDEQPAAKKEEYLEVRGNKYPGLRFDAVSPASDLNWSPVYELIGFTIPNLPPEEFRPMNANSSTTARPHRSGQLISVPLAPPEEEKEEE